MPFLIPLLAPLGGALTGGALTGGAAALAGGAALGGTGASIAGAASGAGSKTTTTTSTPTLSPELQAAQTSTLNDLTGIQKNPSAGLQPIRQAAQDAINRSYATMPNTATQKLAARGFGSSGQVGDAVYDTEGARLGSQSDLYGQIAQLASQRQLSADQIMNMMIQTGKGTTGTVTTPSQSLAAGLLSGGSSIASLLGIIGGSKSGGIGGSGGGGLGGIFGGGAGLGGGIFGGSGLGGGSSLGGLSAISTLAQMLNAGGLSVSAASAPPGPSTLPGGLINRTGNAIDGVPSLPQPATGAPDGSGWAY